MANEPIFLLGVGAQKCGTSWLYKQLAAQREVMMSPIKELHYWDRRFHPGFFRPINRAAQLEKLLKQHGEKMIKSDAFERIAMECGEDYYLAFFRRRLKPHHKVLGEITPSYSILSDVELRHIREFIPYRTKAVFLMREPVERMWSQCKMEAMKSANRGGNKSAYDLFRNSLHVPQYSERARYDLAVKNLLAAFPREDVFFGFYETLFDSAEVQRLALFLEMEKLDFVLDANPNKSDELPRPEIEDWRNVRAGLSHVYEFVFGEFVGLVPSSWHG
ncbi:MULTISPECIES: hypothetical protein [Aphanothece]|uniref:hypothetical protein n=1 Tax=Aphanothece TaxID=1121 RepID=UPI003984FCCD